jgi:hypothetical protein
MDLYETAVSDTSRTFHQRERAALDRYLSEPSESVVLGHEAQAAHLDHLRAALEALREESRPEHPTSEPHAGTATREREERWAVRMAAQIDVTTGTVRHAPSLIEHLRLATDIVHEMARDQTWRAAVTAQSRVPLRARDLVNADPALAQADATLAAHRERAADAGKRWTDFAARPGWERAVRATLFGEEHRLQAELILERLAAKSAEESRNQLRARLFEQKEAEAARFNRDLRQAKHDTAAQFQASERFVQRAAALLVAARETAHTGRPTLPLREARGPVTYCGVREHAWLPIAAFRGERGALFVEHAALCRDAIAAAKLTPGDLALVAQHQDDRLAVTALKRGPNLSILHDEGAGLIAAVQRRDGKVDALDLVLDDGTRARVVPCSTDDLARELSGSSAALRSGGRLDLATGRATEPRSRTGLGRA